MFALGFDPGLAVTGYGVVARDGHRLRAVAAGVIRTDPGLPVAGRLAELHHDVSALLAEHRPSAVAVEQVFVNRNVSTASSVGRASGVILLAAAQAGLEVHEYTPSGVKNAVAGNGRAGKDEVRRMVARTLGLRSLTAPDDAADALAVAICHVQSAPLRAAVAGAERRSR